MELPWKNISVEESDDLEQELAQAPPPGFVTDLAMDQLKGQAPSDAAQALLREQTRVLKLQAEHLHEQREVQLSHLKARRISEWIKVGLQSITAVVGATVLGLVLALVLGAARSRTVVVDAFEVPPALAARGATGKVVANGVLDALTRLQAATRATAAKRKLEGAWAGDIKVEVPETGVSIGELQRLLHNMLGHDLHVAGDLVETAGGGLALTLRADGVLPRTFAGGAGELDALTTRAAEHLYGEVDPYLLAAYLSNAGRTEDALQFLAKAYPRAPDRDRPDLLNQWGNALFARGHAAEAVEKYRTAIQIRPDYWKAWGNLILVLQSAEGEEAAYKAGRQMAVTAAQYGAAKQPDPTNRDAYDPLVQDWAANAADLTWDVRAHGSDGTSSTLAAAQLAAVEAERHDWAAAQAYLAQSDPDDTSTVLSRAWVESRHALERGDAAAAVAWLEPAYARYEADTSVRAYFPQLPCYLGRAYAERGMPAEAMEALGRGGRWLSCFSFKAEALERAGDKAGALAAHRAAVALAPDLPYAYQRFGLALLGRGDAAGAAAQFAAAHARGPHWADPLKGMGDALAAQGRWSKAADSYAQALRHAPHWDELIAASALARARNGAAG